MNEQRVLDRLDPRKDVDGFHPINSGLLSQGRGTLIPCTPKGVMTMLEHYDIPLSGKHAVVIGRSNIVGRPMAQLLRESQMHGDHLSLADHKFRGSFGNGRYRGCSRWDTQDG